MNWQHTRLVGQGNCRTGQAGFRRRDALFWIGSKHQGWIYEFHKLRSSFVHPQEAAASTRWRWSPLEHLLVATFVFPLVAKLLLAGDGLYSLTSADERSLRAIDDLLLLKPWSSGDDETGWQNTLSSFRFKAEIDAVMSQCRHPN
jgi:hypothetical protein